MLEERRRELLGDGLGIRESQGDEEEPITMVLFGEDEDEGSVMGFEDVERTSIESSRIVLISLSVFLIGLMVQLE